MAEILTVLAIIGVIAAVSVPAFWNYMRINRAKTSLRNLISDLRTARAMSVKTGHQVKVVFLPTPAANAVQDFQGCSKCSRSYDYYEGDRAFNSQNWTPITGVLSNPHKPSRTLDNSMYFPTDGSTTPQDFTADPTAGTNGIPTGALQIMFYPDGHMDLPNPATAATYSSTPVDYKTNLTSPPAGGITIQTNPQTPVIKYTLIISASGRIKTL